MPDERARRAFIREHHPDRGGDPEAFARGLAAFDAPAPAPRRRLRVEVTPAPRGLRRWLPGRPSRRRPTRRVD